MRNEIVKDILTIEKILKNRNTDDKLAKYNTGQKIHKKQIMFHKDIHKNRWVFGGNRTGKTECGAVEVVYFARGIHPYRKVEKATNGWVVSLSTKVQRDVAQNKILNYLKKDWIEEIVMVQGRKDSAQYGVIDYILVRNIFGTFSKIGFKTCEMGREKFQGTSLDYVWFDEEPPKDIYDECRMRVLDTDGNIFATMTPLKGKTFVFEEIYMNEGDKNIWHIHMSWEDNPFLDKKVIEQLKSSMSEEQLRSRKDGEFLEFGGKVYVEFDENVHIISPFDVPKEWYDNISIDPGLKNPLSAHWYAVDFDNNVYVIAEHYEAEKDIAYHSEKIYEISNRLGWHRNSNGMISALIDSAANQTTLASSKSVSDLFYDFEILVNSNVNKDLFSGIQRVKNYLKDANGNAKLFIFCTCTNLIREIKSYTWGSNEVPIKKDDHALDELRYYIMSKPQYKPKIIEKSLIQKDKEKRYKQKFCRQR